MIADENGNYRFLDPADEAAQRSLLSALYKSQIGQGRKSRFTITITTFEPRINEKQVSLWDVIIGLIAEESGNSYSEVSTTILVDFAKPVEIPEQMSNSRFQELLLFATAFAFDFFNINIELSDDGQFKIKNK